MRIYGHAEQYAVHSNSIDSLDPPTEVSLFHNSRFLLEAEAKQS